MLSSCGKWSEIHVDLYNQNQSSQNDTPQEVGGDSPGGGGSNNEQVSEGPVNFRLLPGAFNVSDENPHPTFEVSNIPADNLISIYKDDTCSENPIALITPDGNTTAIVSVKGLSNGDIDFYYKLNTDSDTSECLFLGSKVVAGAKYAKEVYKNNRLTIAVLSDDTLVCWGIDSLAAKCNEYNLAGKKLQLVGQNRFSFFLQFTDGTQECLGTNGTGEDCSAVDFNGASNTETVTKVFGNSWSLAGILSDGSVVCWGDNTRGGDCSGVDFDGASNTATVVDIKSSLAAHAAILSDGSVVCWGSTGSGGDCSGVDFDGADNAQTVVELKATIFAMAARLSDGTVVCWGDANHGGNCSGVDLDGADNAQTVTRMYRSYMAFIAILTDDTVVCWGGADGGGDCSGVDFDGASNTETVQDIVPTYISSNNDPNGGGVAALLSDGSVVCWGDTNYGGNCSGVDFDGADNAQTVTKIVSANRAYSALLSDGTVVCWGQTDGGDCTSQDLDGADNAQTVVDLYSSEQSFVGVLSDGSVVCWESSDCTGIDFNGINDTESIDKIFENENNEYVAMLTDGSLLC